LTTQTTTKPDWWISLEDRFSRISPADLPHEPWVLLQTPPGASMSPRGGPFMRVFDNEAFLKHLKADLAAGPDGPRGHVIMNDLASLRLALEEKTSAHHGTTAVAVSAPQPS
jgi:hypothetical protein